MAEGLDPDNLPARGKVSKVSKKYEWNREDRKIGRMDVPVAKFVQTEEEARLQREQIMRYQEAKRIAEEDEKLAQEIYKQLEEQEALEEHLRAEADAQIAQQVQENLLRQRQASEMASTLTDEEYAKQLQEREERKLKERALARAQRQLEQDIARQTQDTLSAYVPETYKGEDHQVHQQMENMRVSRPERLLRYDGKVEDLGDFSDFYILPETGMDNWQKQKLQEIQDEELARLLQDQEHKRGAFINRDKLKAIEAQDEELAKILQEKEKLRLKKLKQKHAQKQLSQQAAEGDTTQRVARQTSQPAHYTHSSLERDEYSMRNEFDEAEMNGTETYLRPRHSTASPPTTPPGTQNHRNAMRNSSVEEYRSMGRSGSTEEHQSSGRRDSGYRTPDRSMGRSGSIEDHRSSGRRDSGHRSPELSHYNGEASGSPHHQPEPPAYNRRPGGGGANSNAFAAIDPTFREDNSSPVAQPRSPGSPTSVVGLTPDDNYCELETVQQAAGIVTGQRRNTSKKSTKERKKSEKDKNCKQQ